ncbi:MAG: IS3 family transposase ISGur6 [Holosporales bacterium]
MIINLIKESHEQGASLSKCCEEIGLKPRTYQRWKGKEDLTDGRCLSIRHASNKLSEEEELKIMETINSKEYGYLPPSKIVPKLADSGIYLASESTMYRLLRRHNQLKNRGLTRPKRHNPPQPFIAMGPNQVWTWDISYLPTTVGGLYYYLYMIIDVYSRKIVGYSVHEKECGSYASCLITQACLDEKIEKDQLVLHSDNGSPMKAHTMQSTLERLGVVKSYSRPSVSNDNPYSESVFKTVKYHATFPKYSRFKSIEEARAWCINFTSWYNKDHMHSGISFVTPESRHNLEDEKLLKNRRLVYEKTKDANPQRWSGNIRKWHHQTSVYLNPGKRKEP